MKALLIRNLNDIAGLTVLMLMSLALVAGQADSSGSAAGHNDEDWQTAGWQTVEWKTTDIRHNGE